MGAPRRLAVRGHVRGRDGTLAFQSYHARLPAREDEAVSPRATRARRDHHEVRQDHLELSKKLGGAAPYFAPTYQKYKAGFIWVLAFVLEAYALRL